MNMARFTKQLRFAPLKKIVCFTQAVLKLVTVGSPGTRGRLQVVAGVIHILGGSLYYSTEARKIRMILQQQLQ